jgi:hypothetical protein
MGCDQQYSLKIDANAAIVEQRIALTWRAVAGKGFVAALRLDQEAQQFALGRAGEDIVTDSRFSPRQVQLGWLAALSLITRPWNFKKP